MLFSSPYIIIANWKMHPAESGEALRWARKIENAAKKIKNVQLAVAPPFIFLESIGRVFKNAVVGAQDVFWKDGVGAYTGEISALQLRNIKTSFVIIGHSERRNYIGETDQIVAHKVSTALKQDDMNVVLCVGEKEHDGKNLSLVVSSQVSKALDKVPAKFLKKLIIAYEPVWAISTTKGSMSAKPLDALQARILIQRVLADKYGTKGKEVRIIYGGSVDEKNIKSFLDEGRMEGALVGSASLDPDKFIKISLIAESLANKYV